VRDGDGEAAEILHLGSAPSALRQERRAALEGQPHALAPTAAKTWLITTSRELAIGIADRAVEAPGAINRKRP